MSDTAFPLNGAEGAAMRISVPDDDTPVQPTVMDLDGAQGRVIETAEKDAAITTISVASVLLDGEQYIVTENDERSMLLYADGKEVLLPHSCVEIDRQG